MSNVQSYNALIDRFKAFASGHFILKTFSHGQIDTADLEKFTEYPFMHVVPSNVTYAKGTKTFSFQIVLADLPRDKDDKVEFQREVLSDLQRIAEDLVAEITNHRVLFGDLITVQNVSLEPFLEEFHNTLTGWTVSLELLVPYYWDACSIPAEWNDMFESGSGGTGSILTFIDSITRDEYGNVSLVNDEATPSPNYYYGTNDEGVRGWFALPEGGGLTCETIGECQTIIDIEAAIDALEEEILLKANTADLGAVAFSNDYNDLDNKPTIPTTTSELTNDGEDGVNPFITAQDLPSLSGYVPYTGATADVNLGTHDLTATQGTFATSGNPDTLTVNHSSGSGKALTITKGGAGEGIYVNKTSGSGNAVTIVGDLEATTLKKTGGTSSQFLKADGSVDSSTYVPTTRTLTINGTSYDLSADRSWTISASASLAVGTTPITSGTVGRILFEGTGNVLQQSGSLFWDNTNSRLGIGTAAPVVRLEVGGDVRFVGSGSTGATTVLGIYNINYQELLRVRNDGLFIFNTPSNILIGTATNAGFKLDVNGTARVQGNAQFGTGFYWDNTNSRLGIGTASPTFGLDVRSTSNVQVSAGSFASALRVENTGSAAYGNKNVASFIGNRGNASNIDDNTNIGIQQKSNILNNYANVNFFNSGGNLSAFLACQYVSHTTPTAHFIFGTANSGTASEKMRIVSNGNVLIGTTTDAGFKLDVNGTARVSGALTAALSSNAGSNPNLLVQTTNGDTAVLRVQNTEGFGSITTNNGVSNFTNNTVALSMQLGFRIAAGGGGIGPNASSILDIVSTTKGFLPPRMTTTQKNAIASPAAGLVVYDTDLGKLCVRGASAWETITSV